jgi:hypothetical protein
MIRWHMDDRRSDGGRRPQRNTCKLADAAGRANWAGSLAGLPGWSPDGALEQLGEISRRPRQWISNLRSAAKAACDWPKCGSSPVPVSTRSKSTGGDPVGQPGLAPGTSCSAMVGVVMTAHHHRPSLTL